MTFTAPLPPIIVDASVAVELAIGDRDDVPLAWRGWLSDVRMLLVPAVYWTEIGHVLLRDARKAVADATARMLVLEASGIEVADRGPEGVRFAMALAERHRLSVYDATYLWLAIDVDGELATFDRALARAAVAESIPLSFAVEP